MFNFPPINLWRNTTTSGAFAATGISPVSTSSVVGRGAALASSSMRECGVNNRALYILGALGIAALGGMAINAAHIAYINRYPTPESTQRTHLREVEIFFNRARQKADPPPGQGNLNEIDAWRLREAVDKVLGLATKGRSIRDEEHLNEAVETVNAAIDEYDKVLASLREKGLPLDEKFTFKRPPICQGGIPQQ